ncbi:MULTISPECIES: Ni/Fe-hydrogenase, b-type cytochrome subunit [Aliarcobacter]|jgi:Ni/Fe-hydrogenase 1 B-type cytochrome subunit|uniref:Ni/Fe-hydrogenase, b-type cytochrome subunit n=1 Tax=Aliarcobacter skirrowii TaxID=28200 RepID=A0A2U2C1H0_9BACT|nr:MULTISPECIES: Ni/Fe-hydrogenase, b-type cytochrome subunit [Aliarcobacter]AZL54704.1 Ni/Fe-hydrogenase, b-type cytochrome subunit [Aliarcobacter skirrowii]MCT7446188.1 Ni/Fe-hydrogenase, b-type cytochrome subunit [Aliarcobacter skirrowii]MDX3959905.1 Ni/Fe-hydrogenase, b-type cytochrome subunit [Aliarcobacter skirrowii]MDX4012627.1 Ni/Fe-hydrogenase, b-type cytochrome subunit [Aliarcobacter skirrowii]MDX4025381.1 Ni/Fe-hydrogenase, b-type cytochrome subunit [Aliarcobacter skirrowii]
MIKKHYEYSVWLRITHWIRVLAITALTFTGFYLAYPFISPALNGGEPTNFLNALMRSWHIIFGFLLICVTIGKIYLFFFDRQSKKERLSFWDFISPKMWIKQIKYYILIGEHTKLKGIYNPLQFMAYSAIYISLIVISLTGLILYIHVYHDGLGGFLFDILRPIEVLMGGLAVVREVHHIFMWIFLIFLPIHIYLVVFNSIYGKKGDMDSIISGYKWEDDHK